MLASSLPLFDVLPYYSNPSAVCHRARYTFRILFAYACVCACVFSTGYVRCAFCLSQLYVYVFVAALFHFNSEQLLLTNDIAALLLLLLLCCLISYENQKLKQPGRD